MQPLNWLPSVTNKCFCKWGNKSSSRWRQHGCMHGENRIATESYFCADAERYEAETYILLAWRSQRQRKMYLFSFCVKTKKTPQLWSQNICVSPRAKCKVLWILNSLVLLEQANHCLPSSSSSSKAQACRGRGATTRTILRAPTVIQARFWPTSAWTN